MTSFQPVALITTDLHLSGKGEDNYRFDFLDWITTNYADKVNAVFILGDLTDRKNFHPDFLVDRIVSAIHALEKRCHVFILRGNHDYDADPSIPFFGFLDRLKNVTYITKPTSFLINKQGWPWKMVFLPNTRDPGKDWDLRKFSNPDVIFMHQTFRGAISETGYQLDGIGTWPFRRFNCPIFSGDIHVPQQVGPITYVGAPYHIHYGDRFEPRILLADNKFRTRTIYSPSPKKLVFDLRTARNLKKEAKDTRPGDMIKVRLHLPISELGSWSEQRDTICRIAEKMQLKLGSVTLKELRSTTSKTQSKEVEQTSKGRSRREVFISYCEKHDIGKELTVAGSTFMET